MTHRMMAVLALALLPVASLQQSTRWAVTLQPTQNPQPIGSYAAVWLTIFDSTTKDILERKRQAEDHDMIDRRARRVFVTGSTGYLGRALSAALLARGHQVDGLCRRTAEQRLVRGVTPVIGDPLDAESYASALQPDHVVVHLVGTPKPAPWKGESFERVDFGSVLQLAHAVRAHPVAHIVYVSVAHPAPVMHAYQHARQRAELVLQNTRLPLTIFRPWYVLGPGHRWPVLLLPLYWLAERVPSLRDGAQRLGLVTLRQMMSMLVNAVESAGAQTRLLEVSDIRRRTTLSP